MLLLLAFISGALAQATLNVPTDYTTLTEAVGAAQNGDTIVVAAGDYDEADTVVVAVDIRIEGAGSGQTTVRSTLGDEVLEVADAEVTLRGITVDGETLRRGILVTGGTLRGAELVVQNGSSFQSAGAGLRVTSGTVELRSCGFYDNVGSDTAGGGVAVVSNSQASFSGCIFEGNEATLFGEGGAIYASSSASLVVGRSDFADNVADDRGGAIFVNATPLSVSASIFTGNSTSDDGGAIAVLNGSADVSDSWFEGNQTVDRGAGVYTINTDLNVVGNVFCQNASSGGDGGGISVQESSVLVRGNVFLDNDALDDGAAVNAISDVSLVSENNHFVANDVGGSGSGPALRTYDDDANVATTIDSTNDLFLANVDGAYTVETSSTAGEISLDHPWFFGNSPTTALYSPGVITNVVTTGQDPLLTGAVSGCDVDVLVPTPSSDLIDGGTGIDAYDGSTADIGAFGGAYPNPWIDRDGDTFIGVYDCDDADPDINPGEAEIVGDDIDQDCDGVDDCFEDRDLDGYGSTLVVTGTTSDCSGLGESSVDTDCDDIPGTGEDFSPETVWYEDGDGDGLGGATTQQSCTEPVSGDWELTSTDCDDGDDGVGDTLAWYPDTDGDQQGDALASADNDDCEPPLSGDWVTNALDCDDDLDTVYDGAPEVTADGVDQNCDQVDVCFEDLDGDTFGTTTVVVGTDLTCENVGESTVDTDCDDGDPLEFPGQEWFLDGDGDGFGVGAATVSCTSPGQDYVTEGGDCDDNDANIGALRTWYPDDDGDGYGDGSTPPGQTLEQCTSPGAGYASNGDDCDDDDATLNPGAAEIPVDGVDQDCDGFELCYEDADGDGFGSSQTVSGSLSCDQAGEQTSDTDCNDSPLDGAGINPMADETCDGVDQDCNGVPDDNPVNAPIWTEDADGDGFGEIGGDTVSACDPPSGYVDDATDCDDADVNTYPGASELCDGVDNDCDGSPEIPGSIPDVDWYPDLDGDGYGDQDATPISDCAPPADHVRDDTDCDDTSDAVNPGATEVPGNSVDEDCDGIVEDPGGDTDMPDDSSRGYPDETPAWVDDAATATDAGCGCDNTPRRGTMLLALLPLLTCLRRRDSGSGTRKFDIPSR